MKPRNPFAVLASKRKAGSHRKSNKALRKQAKQSGYGEKVSHGTFNASFKVQVLVPRPSLY
jgi:hypothetical protein